MYISGLKCFFAVCKTSLINPE